MQPYVETAIQWLYDTLRYQLLSGGNRRREWSAVCWDVGHSLTMMQAHGIPIGPVIDSVSGRLLREFTAKGLQPKDFQQMRRFYLNYFERPQLLPRLAELSWDHHDYILDHCPDPLEQEFYLDLCLREKMSRRALARAVESRKYELSAV